MELRGQYSISIHPFFYHKQHPPPTHSFDNNIGFLLLCHTAAWDGQLHYVIGAVSVSSIEDLKGHQLLL